MLCLIFVVVGDLLVTSEKMPEDLVTGVQAWTRCACGSAIKIARSHSACKQRRIFQVCLKKVFRVSSCSLIFLSCDLLIMEPWKLIYMFRIFLLMSRKIQFLVSWTRKAIHFFFLTRDGQEPGKKVVADFFFFGLVSKRLSCEDTNKALVCVRQQRTCFFSSRERWGYIF